MHVATFQITEGLRLSPVPVDRIAVAVREPDARVWVDLLGGTTDEVGTWLDRLGVDGGIGFSIADSPVVWSSDAAAEGKGGGRSAKKRLGGGSAAQERHPEGVVGAGGSASGSVPVGGEHSFARRRS